MSKKPEDIIQQVDHQKKPAKPQYFTRERVNPQTPDHTTVTGKGQQVPTPTTLRESPIKIRLKETNHPGAKKTEHLSANALLVAPERPTTSGIKLNKSSGKTNPFAVHIARREHSSPRNGNPVVFKKAMNTLSKPRPTSRVDGGVASTPVAEEGLCKLITPDQDSHQPTTRRGSADKEPISPSKLKKLIASKATFRGFPCNQLSGSKGTQPTYDLFTEVPTMRLFYTDGIQTRVDGLHVLPKQQFTALYLKKTTGSAYTHRGEKLIWYSRMYLNRKLKAVIRLQPNHNNPAQKMPRTSAKNKQTSRGQGFWFNYYAFNNLQPLIGEPLTVINFNILSAASLLNYKKITRDALQAFPFLQLNRVAAHFIATVYTALVLKESKPLATFIKKVMREVHFKKHPFYFNFVSSLVKDTVKPQLHLFNCLGLSVVFRGKLGIGGNARKRALKYQTGMISSSSKYVKLSRSIDIVRTKTGVVGFTVIVAW